MEVITYPQFKNQSIKIMEILNARFWEVDGNNHIAKYKPKYQNAPKEIIIENESVSSSGAVYEDNKVTLPTGDGNVTISGNNYDKIQTEIFFSSGTPKVALNASNVSLKSNSDDFITLQGAADCTIYGGGNTTSITNNDAQNPHIFQISNSSSNKIIFGFNEKDTIQILGAPGFTAANLDKSDTAVVTLSAGGSAKFVSLQSASGDFVNIINEDGALISGDGVANSVTLS